jgi:acetyl-CoA/propionyl-CoA carboxylase biotin carboxyl carrier protein
VSTRDCSLQRRHQKLVEEAPAPFLTPAQLDQLYTSSKAILREAGYVGAGTCEFLVAADGTVSFLEVNTRLQVEHPVSEEVTGLDLVREQFRVAAGEPLGYGDPEVRGHSIEFRLNGEDPGRNFLPQPGPVTVWSPASGPGVRVDAGVEAGSVVSGAFDSLLAKLIVTGRTREEALARSARALREFRVDGLPTTLPFFRAVVSDPAFAPTDGSAMTVHTRWIEAEWLATDAAKAIDPFTAPPVDGAAPAPKQTVVVEVNGRRMEVVLPGDLVAAAPANGRPAAGARPGRKGGTHKAAAPATGALTSPMQGTVVKIAIADGDTVAEGDLVVVLEAMKMEQPLLAHRAGTVKGLSLTVGQTVTAGSVVCEID